MLVDNQIEDGERLLHQLAEEGFAVATAGWIKLSEDDRWNLYIATSLVDEKGPLAAYQDVLRIFRALGAVWLSDSDITLIGEKNRITVEVLSFLRCHPGRIATRIRGSLLGSAPFEELYFYPISSWLGSQTELNDEKKRLLIALFSESSRELDDLPYTTEMEQIRRAFNRQTELNWKTRDVFKALQNLSKGGLGGELPSPTETSPAQSSATSE